MTLPRDLEARPLVLLQADIDDATAESIAWAAGRLLDAGALDVVVLSIGMKKGRPGTRLEALAEPALQDRLLGIFLRETTTLGVRVLQVQRYALARRAASVTVRGRSIRVKVALWDGEPFRAKPEHDDCAAASEALGVPLAEIIGEARRAIRETIGVS